MKKIKPFLLLVLFFGSILSCDELDEALTKEVEVTRILTSTVSINYDKFDSSFRETGFFENNSGYEANIGPDDISRIEIQSIKYEYKNFSGNTDAVIVGSNFYFGNNVSGQDFPLEDTNVAEADLLVKLFNVSGDFGVANDALLSSKSFFAYAFSGNLSHAPAIFDVEFTVTVKLFVELSL